MPKTVINVVTGERKIVELTEAELAQVAIDKAAWDIEFSRRQAEEARKIEKQALIDKMLSERSDAPDWIKQGAQNGKGS